MKLDKKALGLTLGIIWGGSIFLLTLLSYSTGFGYITLTQLSIYPWYQISVSGAIIGGVWGFIDGYAGGYIISVLYNKFSKKK